MKALITGITGQDGHLLTRFLLEKNYDVIGVSHGQSNKKLEEFGRIFPNVKILKGDLTDISSLFSVLSESEPDEIYNLAGLSHVGLSFRQPENTANVTGLGFVRLLEAVRKLDMADSLKIYQASSSEMFGKVEEIPQTEKTPFHPRSPYGVAKAFAHHTAVNYREAYNMHISCGILFNHESEFRGHEFVTRKITSNIAKIKLGQIKKFKLGSLLPKRDWGYAGDYVESMWLMTQQSVSDSYVISTGETHSIRDFLEIALDTADLPREIDRFVEFDKDLIRPAEVDILIGDSTKARNELGWRPKTSFKKLIEIMVENDLRLESTKDTY
jgi:GDPmannose 4,6-dehydratase